MHPLRLSTSLLLLICFTSAIIPLNSLAPEAAGATELISNCTPVPYPFGVPGVALKGFEVACTGTTTADRTKKLPFANWTQQLTPSLLLQTGTYLIQNISLQGQVRIYTGPIYQQCYGNGTEMLTRGTGWLNLSGTPFTLSKNYTNFIAIGCDDVVMIETVDGDGKNGSKTFRSGCVAFCSNSSSRIDGSCSGLGCCQMPLPGPGGLKSFDLNLYKIPNMVVNRLTNCSAAFLTAHDEFSFKTAYFDNKDYFNSRGGDHVVVLDWAVGNTTCAEAKKDVNSFACQKNSQCYDSPNGVGYICNCTQGYEGNPYIATGCTDVNECQYPETNPCTGRCINTDGGYKCDCPTGMTGDGKKEGSGCEKAFPLDVVLGVCLGLVFILAMAIFYYYSRLQKRKLVQMRSVFFRQNGGWILQQRLASQGIDSTTRIFTEEELQKATENYSENRILGRGGYGTVYKGLLSNQQVVAIKRSKLIDESQVEQFINEITILSQINHRNVVRLLGCCLETQVPLLVYEFISNGTLFKHIHDQDFLPWEDRLRISKETAHAIAYLHSAASFPIIHRDIKSSNILLDEKYTAKVSDFGASRSVPFDCTHVTTLVQGTLGYLDPEYFHTSQLTEKSDVYSFGVVLAELITGQMPISFDRPEDLRNLATYFTSLVDEGRLVRAIEPHILKEAKLDELHFVAHLARRCLNVKGEDRPAMKELALELEGLRKAVKKRANDRSITEREWFVQEIGSTSSLISEVSESSRQYSLDTELLSTIRHPR
ncbi:Wall-associated kinase family protein [Rhynchospora pubera]|uniref:Wall-associated kinase family protein n=1 Tax=Rhynchospora pubera TaxID=906938 RepID=A0AAV8CSU7_9POAL|nr:Wall-associated kinase family protein [Rhynchospora pubera]